MDMKFRALKQLEEAFGKDNQYFCSLHYRQSITDRVVLLEYFIKNGGAEDFAERYDEALSAKNRWFCSEHFGREINDDKTLWNYYVANANAVCGQIEPDLSTHYTAERQSR